jgi:hypothetical protein
MLKKPCHARIALLLLSLLAMAGCNGPRPTSTLASFPPTLPPTPVKLKVSVTPYRLSIEDGTRLTPATLPPYTPPPTQALPTATTEPRPIVRTPGPVVREIPVTQVTRTFGPVSLDVLPTATRTPLPTIPTATPTATRTPGPTPTFTLTYTPIFYAPIGVTYRLRSDAVVYRQHPGGCEQTTFAGSVFNLDGNPVANQHIVRIWGEGVDETVAPGSAPNWGPGAFDVTLPDLVTGTYRVQLMEPDEKAISDVFTFPALGECGMNFIIMDFEPDER